MESLSHHKTPVVLFKLSGKTMGKLCTTSKKGTQRKHQFSGNFKLVGKTTSLVVITPLNLNFSTYSKENTSWIKWIF